MFRHKNTRFHTKWPGLIQKIRHCHFRTLRSWFLHILQQYILETANNTKRERDYIDIKVYIYIYVCVCVLSIVAPCLLLGLENKHRSRIKC